MLPRREVTTQHFGPRLRCVDLDVIAAGAFTTTAQLVNECVEFAQIAFPKLGGTSEKLRNAFQSDEFNRSVQIKIDLQRIENMKQNYFAAAKPEVLNTAQHVVHV